MSEFDLVEAALRVVERSSLHKLTVRAVADECGVTAPAIHYHLRGKADLADRVVEAVAAGIEISIEPDDHWIDQYIGLVAAMDRAFLRYPGTGLHALTAEGRSAAAARLSATALDILRGAGFPDRDAREIFTATYLIFVGWLATRGRAESGTTHPALAAAGTATGNDGIEALESALRHLFEGAKHVTQNERRNSEH
ncbi:TetR/AcrR family transcriptional regulator [Williamsia muralis]|uniref:Helix-turn-helix domain-containing protein n=1 Tax=Williamsia marianensis TaxID=85044 RepID=A0ABU4EYT2_WILMA|nr:helix-turn-helix domain-containing protein [Williamsia muralis]MDV7136405.1 helix-turn-helix domain-containing protein [Williamsia muralis]